MLGSAALVVGLGLPIIAGATQLEADQRAAGMADAAALAAADAENGWIEGEPCTVASEVALAGGAELLKCEIVQGDAVVTARVAAPLGAREAAARAGPSGIPEQDEAIGDGAAGWVWPSGVRGITQTYHDGLALDLAVSSGGELFAPFDGVVVIAGPDGGGVHASCEAHPDWWHGPNQVVLLRHEYRGAVLFSSVNHLEPGSSLIYGVIPGAKVVAGQRLGTAGLSGCTSGPHTHFTLSTQASNTAANLDPGDYIGRP